MSTAQKLDLFGEDICKHPYAFAKPLRDAAPIFFDQAMGFWVVTSNEDCKQLFMHEDMHLSPKFSGNYSSVDYAKHYPVSQKFREDNPFNDEIKHPLVRKLLVRAFSPSALRRIENQIKETIDRIVKEKLSRPGVVDVARDFADQIPYAVLTSIYGVDRLLENKEEFLGYCKTMARMIDPTLSHEQRLFSEQCAVAMHGELQTLVNRARENPGEDLISDFLKAADEIGGLTDDDIKYTLLALIITGSTATTFTLTLVIHAYLTQHAQRAWLQANPDQIDSAVEELVRFAHGGKFAYRFVIRDTEYKGHKFLKGQTVLLSFAGMNNDPAAFDAPELCQFARNNKNALSFGHGVHYCVGAHVARTEIRYLVKAFMDYAPNARILDDKVTWNLFNFINREISSLPVDTGHI